MTTKDLVSAVINGDLAEVTRHLDAGADPNAHLGHGRTPLFFAAAQRHPVALLDVLLSRGADIHARDSAGLDVLHVYLQDCGPGARLIPGDAVAFLPMAQRMLEAGLDVRARNADRPHSLQACMTGNAPLLELVLAHGSDANAKDNEGGVLWRSLYKTDGRTKPLLATLVKHHVDPNTHVKNAAVDSSILMEVCTCGDLETAQTLLDRGADPNFVGTRGSVLSRAIESGNQVLVDLLYERGARTLAPQRSAEAIRELDLAEVNARTAPVAWARALAAHGFRGAAWANASLPDELLTVVPGWTFVSRPRGEPMGRVPDARVPQARLTDGKRTLPLVILLGAPCTACDEQGEQVCCICDGAGFWTGQHDDFEYPCEPRMPCARCLGLKFEVHRGEHLGRGTCAHPNVVDEFEFAAHQKLKRCSDCGLAALWYEPRVVRAVMRTSFACGLCGHFVCVCARKD